MAAFLRYFFRVKTNKYIAILPVFFLGACARDISTEMPTSTSSANSACSKIEIQNKSWDEANSQQLFSCFFGSSDNENNAASATLSQELLALPTSAFRESAKFFNRVTSPEHWSTFVNALSKIPTGAGEFLATPAGQEFFRSPVALPLLKHTDWILPLLHEGVLQKLMRLFHSEDLPTVMRGWQSLMALSEKDRLAWLSSGNVILKGVERDGEVFRALKTLNESSSCRVGAMPYSLQSPLGVVFKKIKTGLGQPQRMMALLEQSYFFFHNLCPTHEVAQKATFHKLLQFLGANVAHFQRLFANGEATDALVELTLRRLLEKNEAGQIDYLFRIAEATQKDERIFTLFNHDEGQAELGRLLALQMDLGFFEKLSWTEMNYLRWIFVQAAETGTPLNEWLAMYARFSAGAREEFAAFFVNNTQARWSELAQRLWPQYQYQASSAPSLLKHAELPALAPLPSVHAVSTCLDRPIESQILSCTFQRLGMPANTLKTFSEVKWDELMNRWTSDGSFEKVRVLFEQLLANPPMIALLQTLKDNPYPGALPFDSLSRWTRTAKIPTRRTRVLLCQNARSCSDTLVTGLEVGWELLRQFHFPVLPAWAQKKVYQLVLGRLTMLNSESAVRSFYLQSEILIEIFNLVATFAPRMPDLELRQKNIRALMAALPTVYSEREFLQLLEVLKMSDADYVAGLLSRPETHRLVADLRKDLAPLAQIAPGLHFVVAEPIHKALLQSSTQPANIGALLTWIQSGLPRDILDIVSTVKQMSP